jgi:hypothetical protein
MRRRGAHDVPAEDAGAADDDTGCRGGGWLWVRQALSLIGCSAIEDFAENLNHLVVELLCDGSNSMHLS